MAYIRVDASPTEVHTSTYACTATHYSSIPETDVTPSGEELIQQLVARARTDRLQLTSKDGLLGR